MAGGRVEPFQLAVLALRERLRTGEFRAGGHIAVTELADALQLSATPVGQAREPAQHEHFLQLRRECKDDLLEKERLVLRA
jgi:DNA-binding GntR family transcriptional regulator